jgi:hypothetical protein
MLLDRPGSNSNQSFLQGSLANQKNTSVDRAATGRMAHPKSKQEDRGKDLQRV